MAPRKDKPDEPLPTPAATAIPQTVSIQEFITTRDRVVNGLSSLQVAIASLLNAYLEHCKLVAGDAYPNPQFDANMFGNPLGQQPLIDTTGLTKGGKKKKEKKIRDPLAPKRPLTAAFLFSMKARPIVKGDLEKNLVAGEKLGPNAVNEEVTRRWNELPEEQKEMWRIEYRKNLVTYKEDVEKYNATKAAIGEDADADAVADDDIIAADFDADSDAEGDEDDAPEPMPIVPQSAGKAGAKRRKTGKENGVIVPSPAAAIEARRLLLLLLPNQTAPSPQRAEPRRAPKPTRSQRRLLPVESASAKPQRRERVRAHV
ncbi:hypothetical protein EJ05DRAFT_364113 [Pseudovirgaria hyperparasitica]|uniref:HMG box domain-containing protein n=1 Tax=Pseudovirgaria hyperparasitica TaxID=470096 RepID=A0A6A6WCF6_9PEZI|nr:uncharacterized protein EJ05DRAFT_364113 [Pseudovirgaria hyperparasitica]KAF2758791.1 hypothetical protein EJ05DRAFT_364113 [Pseudovirgaria hyperparasitica]